MQEVRQVLAPEGVWVIVDIASEGATLRAVLKAFRGVRGRLEPCSDVTEPFEVNVSSGEW